MAEKRADKEIERQKPNILEQIEGRQVSQAGERHHDASARPQWAPLHRGHGHHSGEYRQLAESS